MNKKLTSEVDVAGSSCKSRRHLPKRGQIKWQIAANAYHSIVYLLMRRTSNGILGIANFRADDFLSLEEHK